MKGMEHRMHACMGWIGDKVGRKKKMDGWSDGCLDRCMHVR